MCSMRSRPRIRRQPIVFDPNAQCPAFVVNPKIAPAALAEQRADEVQYAQLVKAKVSVAPIHSGLDGGMNPVFQARLPGKIISLALVLPPGAGIELPQLPSVPWTDHDGSLANKFFGALPELKPGSQAHVASTNSTTRGGDADLAPTAPAAVPTTTLAFPVETDVEGRNPDSLRLKHSAYGRIATDRAAGLRWNKSSVINCIFRIRGIMRTKLLAVSCGILFLLGTDHVFAEHVSSPFLKLCEAANVNAPDTSAADGPIEPETGPGTQKAKAKPARSVEDVALSERLQDFLANKLQQYVTRPQDRTAVEAFYRERDFTPLWVNAGGALPATQKVSTSCMVSLLMDLIRRIIPRQLLLI